MNDGVRVKHEMLAELTASVIPETMSAKKAAKGVSKKVARKVVKKVAKKAARRKPPSIEARIAAAVASTLVVENDLSPADGARMAAAPPAPPARSYPPILAFLKAFCSAAEGRSVGANEVLGNLRNVRKPVLNAAINDTYHIPAGVARYPGTRPDFQLTLRGAAFDIQSDLSSKGVQVPI